MSPSQSPSASPRLCALVVRRAKPGTVRVLGLDQSLSSTGYSYRLMDGPPVTGTIDTGELRGSHRLFYIRKKVLELIERIQPTLVVLEGYAMGFSRGKSRLADLGELGGTIKLAVWESGVDTLIVAPASLKSIIAGNGKGDKEDVKKALKSQYGFIIGNSDEADALGLMLIGEAKRGKTKLKATAARMAVVHSSEVLRGQLKLGVLKSTSRQQAES